MTILLIDECYPLNTRNTKILESLQRQYPESHIHVITWDRSGTFDGGTPSWTYHLFTKSAQYGNKFQKLIGLFAYRTFCHDVIRQVTPDVVFASHWNNLLMLPKMDYKHQMVIYENLDAPTGPYLGRRILNLVEYSYMKKIALTVHASRFYLDIYPKHYPQLVLENKPTIQTNLVSYSPSHPLRVVYLGNVRYLWILKNLVDAVRNHPEIQLLVHGGGPDYQELLDYSRTADNVILTGPYKYSDIGNFYNNADIIWAAYPNRDFNVKYAISNKFHESMAYGIPAIYADQTMLGQYAERENIGYQVDPYSAPVIEQLLLKLAQNPDSLISVHESLRTHSKAETTWDQDIIRLVNSINEFFS